MNRKYSLSFFIVNLNFEKKGETLFYQSMIWWYFLCLCGVKIAYKLTNSLQTNRKVISYKLGIEKLKTNWFN